MRIWLAALGLVICISLLTFARLEARTGMEHGRRTISGKWNRHGWMLSRCRIWQFCGKCSPMILWGPRSAEACWAKMM